MANIPNDPFNPTPAEVKAKADADARARVVGPVPETTETRLKADADARAKADNATAAGRASVYGYDSHEYPKSAAKGPFNLTTDDVFLLKDLNHDGIMDTIVVERVDKAAIAAAKAEEDKYAPYHKAVADAKQAATNANAGRPVIEVTAAENVAVAKAKAEFKGAVPQPTKVEADKVAADKVAAEHKAAVAAEINKLNSKV